MEDKYDSALLGILQHEGKIERFLDAMLGFLYRRTDFYRHMKSKEDKLGFPPGVALKMLTTIFHKYDEMTRRDDQFREAQRESVQQNKTATQCKTVKVEPTEDNSPNSASAQANTETFIPSDLKPDKVLPVPEVKSDQTENNSVPTERSDMQDTNNLNNPSDSNESSPPKNESDEDDVELTRQQQAFQSNPESYNGAVRDGYSWAQSITDVDVRVKEKLCRHCGKVYRSLASLSIHERKHAEVGPHKCCGKVFYSKTHLDRHRCSVHEQQTSFKCTICVKCFASKGDLEQHTRIKHQDGQLSCEICRSKFKVKRDLTVHLASHRKEKCYSCNCGKGFASRSGLAYHRKRCLNKK